MTQRQRGCAAVLFPPRKTEIETPAQGRKVKGNAVLARNFFQLVRIDTLAGENAVPRGSRPRVVVGRSVEMTIGIGPFLDNAMRSFRLRIIKYERHVAG